MIIFGTRGITTTPDAGQFCCPRCGPDHSYQKKKVRRFFTLYFIPVIPLNELGQYVECQQCRGTYDVAVLDYDPRAGVVALQARFEVVIKQVMILMTLADGVVDDTEISTMAAIYGRLSGHGIAENDLRREVESARLNPRPVAEYLEESASALNNEGKEMVIKAMFFVAAADGEIEDSEFGLLARAAEAMEMSKAHFRGILAELTS